MLKAGIIGLGHGSRVLIDAFRLNNVEVYGVTSKNYSKAKKISKEKNISKTFRNWKELVKDKRITIVAIAVPPYLQLNILKACLKNNKKILCEKPIGIEIKKINNFFLNIKKNNKFFFVDYIYPEHEKFKKFYTILNKIKITKDSSIKVNFNTQTYINKYKIINWKSSPAKGGGIIYQFLSHIIDYLIWFFGSINEVNCKTIKNGQREILANCFIKFKSGIKASVLLNLNNPRKVHLIQYKSNKYKIILKNTGSDYGKKFIIDFKEIGKNNKYKSKKIAINDLTNKFNGDSRILLTSRVIKKIKKGVNKSYQTKNLKRFQYNEYILHCMHRSIKEKKSILIL